MGLNLPVGETIDIGNISLTHDSYINYLNEININIDCIITDPPSLSELDLFHWSNVKDLLKQLEQNLRNDGHIYIFIKDMNDFYWINSYFEVFSLLTYKTVCKPNLKNKYTENTGHIIFIGDEDKDLNEPKNTFLGEYKIGDKYHDEQKPLELIMELINQSTKENNIILDPFFGGGTVAEAAKNTERKFFGCEKDRAAFTIAQQRIRQGSKQLQIL
jgi:site-specific DNA-methyltransferase (adenine-specific)